MLRLTGSVTRKLQISFNVRQFQKCLAKAISICHSSTAIRNVGIVAHVDAGKTTTSEQMLYLAGKTHSVGRVDDGDSVMDFLPLERERGITISSAAITLQWKDTKINLIDTPGHVDFTFEVERSARVLDGAIVVVDAVSGVQAQTRTVWRQVRKQGIPSVVFVNKMDRAGASFENALSSISRKLECNVFPIQAPIGAEGDFSGVIDLISLSKLQWPLQSSSRVPENPSVTSICPKIDEALYLEAVEKRKAMIESIAEVDDEMMGLYLAEEEPTTRQILEAIRRSCLAGDAVPALCGASLKGKGVQPILDSIVAFLPSPGERPLQTLVHKKTGEKKTIKANDNSLCALAFKIVNDPARGLLTYMRIFSGSIHAKQVLYNANQDGKERVNQLLHVSADELGNTSDIEHGNICCVVGLKNTKTGDTLVQENSPYTKYVLDGLHIPEPVFSLAIETEKASQQNELEKALVMLCTEDPSLQFEVNPESGQTLVKGVGELHLEIVCEKLRREFKLEVFTGAAYVAYRESVVKSDEKETAVPYRFEREINGKRLFAEMLFEARPSLSEDTTVPSTFSVPKHVKEKLSNDEYAAIRDAAINSFTRGPSGYPVVGVEILVSDVSRDADTSSGALRACVSMFISEYLRNEGRSCILEPIMLVEAEASSAQIGDVVSDLTVKRRGSILEIASAGGGTANRMSVTALVPLAATLGYATALRSMTQGDASFTMEYKHHVEVDKSLVINGI